MGIPSYFSHVVRANPELIKPFLPQVVAHLYMDCNSIIYDVVASLEEPNTASIVSGVCAKIDAYLALIQPTHVYLAFDGVPPFAKMKQQRERRYKSEHTQKWNTVQITPGTAFMQSLNDGLRLHYGLCDQFAEFHVSTSEECGEGEHKLFAHLRQSECQGPTLVYGLDADLIMLSLVHLKYRPIQLVREAPAFLVEGDGLYVFDVPALSTKLGVPVMDYVVMTMMLGNDFMPHFPSLNLRTTGMQTLLAAYHASSVVLYDHGIVWPAMRMLITALAKGEKDRMVKEYTKRNHAKVDVSTPDKIKEQLPMLHRSLEHHICPYRTHWESRYYKALFPRTTVKTICAHYVRMLQWTMDYYEHGCLNWSMSYPYMYPPLLVDLAHHIPDTVRTVKDESHISTPTELLLYVLPPHCYEYIPNHEKYTRPTHKHELVWAFCRYTWESHVKFTPTPTRQKSDKVV